MLEWLECVYLFPRRADLPLGDLTKGGGIEME